MLSDTIRTVKDAEEKAAARVAEARQAAKADIAAATAAAADAETAAIEAAKAAKEAGDRRVLDARGMAKATADASGEITKKKAADAVEEILGGIRRQWQ